jgi:hypothetical protein
MKGKGIILAQELVLTTGSLYATTGAGDTRQAINGIKTERQVRKKHLVLHPSPSIPKTQKYVSQAAAS